MDPQCLSKVQARFHLDLHPSKLYDVEQGVNEHLNSILFKYQDDLEGFVMAYQGAKILSKNATIHPYFPLVQVQVQAQVLLFKPTVGCMLIGRVIKVAADFVGLLVLGVFNASIAAESIRSDLKCNLWDQSLVSKKHPKHEIRLGTEVRFQVVKLQEAASFFGIFGSLVDKSTGSVEFLHKQGRLGSADARKAKEDAQLNGVPGQEMKAAAGGATPREEKQARKKSKKVDGQAAVPVKLPISQNGVDAAAEKGGDGSKKKKKREQEGAGSERKKKKKKNAEE